LPRAYELTDLRAIAIVLLFFVHSNLQLSTPFFALELQKWMLSAFFFVSGYLTCSSVNRKGATTKDFFVHRFGALYIPFVLIMAFYVLADNIIHYTPLAFLSCASFLCLFYVFSDPITPYNVGQFWFIPVLLVFTALFILLDKCVRKDVPRLFVLFALFAFNLLNYMFWTPIRLIWGFGLYLFVFALGYEFSRRNLFQKLRTLRMTLILVLAAIVTQVLNVALAPTWDMWISIDAARATSIDRLGYFSFLWIGNTVFSVSTLILILIALFYMRQNFSTNKVYGVAGILGSCTLWIYLWEPYVSPRISLYIFGTSTYYSLSGSLLFVSVLIRIVTVTPVAYGMQKLYNGIERALKID
jgi:hypothetical protein